MLTWGELVARGVQKKPDLVEGITLASAVTQGVLLDATAYFIKGVTSFGEEAAKSLGASEEQVFKTLLIVHEKDFAVAIVPVSGKLNIKAAAAALGWKSASMCDPKVAERRTGYVVGGISPLGQKTPSPTLLDESAQLFDTIMVSGGKRGLDVELAPDDLLKLTNGKYADIRA